MSDMNALFQQASVIGGRAVSSNVLMIDHNFRQIAIPCEKKLAGVTNDEAVNQLVFQCDRYYGETDLADFTFRINFTNADGEGDQYICRDKTVDDYNITFTWVLGRHATATIGDISFIVCAVLSEQDGTVKQEYNTGIHTLTVIQGMETSEEVYTEYRDLIEEFYHNIEWTENVEAYIYGTKNGEPVGPEDPAYHNNAKYFRDEAILAIDDAEAWAIGQKHGEDVPQSDPTYQNNAKFYAILASHGADRSGYAWFDVHDEDGYMYVYISDNLSEDVEFSVIEDTGVLEVTYH